MATNSLATLYTRVAGGMKRIFAVKTTDGTSADKDRIIATNDNGLLDKSFLGAVATSAGAADAGKPILTNGQGTIDATLLPNGVGAAVQTFPAFEAIGAGKLVNVFNDSGTTKVRLADNTAVGKKANGYVLASVASGATATVYFDDLNTSVTGLTPGADYFLGTAGNVILEAALPTADNTIVQYVGFASAAGVLNVEIESIPFIN